MSHSRAGRAAPSRARRRVIPGRAGSRRQIPVPSPAWPGSGSKGHQTGLSAPSGAPLGTAV